MKLNMIAPLTITGIVCAAAMAAGAVATPTVATKAASAQPAATVKQTAAPAPGEEKAPKISSITIRVDAPIFVPAFSKVPLAMVNDEPVTVGDLKKTLGTIHEGMTDDKAAPKQDYEELLKRLINSLLIIQEARNMELDKLDEIKNAVDDYSKKTLREMLLKEQVKNVKASAKEVDKAYQERTAEWRLKSLIIDKLDDVKELEAGLKAGKKFDDLCAAAIKDGKAKEGGKSDTFIARDVIAPSMLTVLQKMKVGDISKPLALDKGYLIYRVEEARHKDDPALKEKVQQELDAKDRVNALEAFQKEMIKKYVTQKKLFDKLDLENKKVKFETLLKDKRVLADVKGEKPVTVAMFADAVASKFYHGVQRAIESHKVNKEKRTIMDELLGTIVFDKEAKARKIDQSEEFQTKVKNYGNSLLFGTFINKVVRPDIVVTKDDLQNYYKEHAKEYTTVESYKLDAIAFDSPKKAEEAVDKLRKGMDFKWLKTNADGKVDIDAAYFGMFDGEAIAKPNLPEPLQKALAGAATGDYRVLVNGTHGYAIAVQDAQGSKIKTYPEVEEVVKEAMFYKKLNEGIDTWANKLRNTSDVTIYADFSH